MKNIVNALTDINQHQDVQNFNKLGTALINDPEYVATVATTKDGEIETKETRPVAELRKKMIGDVLKAAGHDATEQENALRKAFGLAPKK